ncbi:AarF/UbiB family protein [bacterium]|nr:AarF/UbiB family protein [bacterium]
MFTFLKTLKCCFFLLNMAFILGTEGLIYLLYRDYSLSIDRITLRLASINILYVKMFQAIALNNKLIDETINNKLLRFTDNVPWDYSDVNLSEIVEISKKFDLTLRQGYEIPINSGMISLVFKAYKKDATQTPVILKIKRTNIEEKLNDAIDNLLFSLYVLSFIPIFDKIQLANLINENIEIVRHQTNFLEEIENMSRMKHNCRNLKYVKIPYSDRAVTEQFPNCILMEFIEGLKINQLQKEDCCDFAKQVVKFGVVTTLVHGVAHADLHSGNILFIKDKNDVKYPHKIGVIDFGIIHEIDQLFKETLFNVFTPIFTSQPRETAIKLLNSGFIEPQNILQLIPKDDSENIIDITTQIIDKTINVCKNANQMQIYNFFNQLTVYFSKPSMSNIGIRPSNQFIKCQMLLAMAHGVTLSLCDDDYVPIVDKVINELFHMDMIE